MSKEWKQERIKYLQSLSLKELINHIVTSDWDDKQIIEELKRRILL